MDPPLKGFVCSGCLGPKHRSNHKVFDGTLTYITCGCWASDASYWWQAILKLILRGRLLQKPLDACRYCCKLGKIYCIWIYMTCLDTYSDLAKQRLAVVAVMLAMLMLCDQIWCTWMLMLSDIYVSSKFGFAARMDHTDVYIYIFIYIYMIIYVHQYLYIHWIYIYIHTLITRGMMLPLPEGTHKYCTRWWFQRFHWFTPILGEEYLTNIFQLGWNHRL